MEKNICDNCLTCISIIYYEYDHEQYEEFSQSYFTDDGLQLCSACVCKCNKCKKYTDSKTCLKCFKKDLIENTFNNITKKLPNELVFMILQKV